MEIDYQARTIRIKL